MRAAVLRGLRPTTLTHRRRNPYGKWNELDFLLLEAFQSLEDETSKSHGLPVWLSRADDGTVEFGVEEGVDLADAAIADFDKRSKGPKGKEPPAGTFRYVVASSTGGGPPPEGGLARERLLRGFHEQHAERPATESTLDSLGVQRRRPAKGYDTSDYG